MRKLAAVWCLMAMLFPGCSSAEKLSPEAQFKQSFPDKTYETFKATSVPGVYELYNGRQIFYYLPSADVVLYGSLVTKDGVNLTRESHLQKMTPKFASLPLDQALKVGNGKKIVVEFTDPNCPYCRQGFEFFNKIKEDVTLYIFLVPLSADSERKIRHILCSSDRVRAYEEVFSGKFDSGSGLNACKDPKVGEQMRAHRDLAQHVGLRGTPLFYLRGKVVDGFDPPALQTLLEE
ncbi:MAG TPA: DsbC family protein [Smithellaceae bacterium]|nr:DsbC family protein [Smithellaceae bacterium]